MGTIVLVGTGLPTEILDNAASVSAIEEDEIRRVPRSSVAQILDSVPGVRVTQSGIERITIRGEGSQRVSIMLDGNPITDHTGYGTPILVSPSNIERIEVVRGSSSVVSGNNALGGVVNIITKRGGSAPLEVDASVGYSSANEGKEASISAGGTTGNFDYRLTFSKSEQGDLETADGTLDDSDKSEREISAFLGYRHENHYFGARIQDFDLDANVWTGDPDFSISLPKRDLRKYSAFYEGEDLTPWLSKLTFNIYKQEIDRAFVNDLQNIGIGPGMTMDVLSTSDDLQETWGMTGQADLSLAEGHRTTLGFSYEDDSQKSDKLSQTIVSVSPFPSVTTRVSDANIRTFSVFGQHEAELSDTLTATVGARYYKVKSDLDSYVINGVSQDGRSSDDSRWLGSLGLVYKPNEDTALRANISQGYNYPTLAQLYLETTAGGSGITYGNPDLKPETATTYELGARIDRGALTFDGTVFYSEADNYISYGTYTGPGAAAGDRTYINVNTARTWGVEVSAEYRSNLWDLRPYLQAEYLEREFTYANGFSTYDSGAPNFAATLGVRRDWSLGNVSGEWDLFVSGEGTAKLRGSDGAITNQADAYHTVNFQLSADLNDQFSFSLSANNLLDESYTPINQYQGAGRNIAFRLNASF
ncbi:TonB-dependent receptor [Tropicibacter sp. R15_0]|uniref:TonB-dependent receptor n=1 Tax=Tropicibacter sp. R15_0 TaxID=2821101 RepID=UPI001AD9C5BD|nr:TonB-dependent receptor [Tropicibacter sp. R15_0]MBO9467819.1 TonB-dependent receptor [Tropicibacter sp. R15_0]